MVGKLRMKSVAAIIAAAFMIIFMPAFCGSIFIQYTDLQSFVQQWLLGAFMLTYAIIAIDHFLGL